MKSLRLLPLLLIVLALGLPTPTHAQSDAPYIYYYSDLLKGWVIERADGTDGRVIGQGIQQADFYFDDMVWSHSGRWMSWRSAAWCGPCGRSYGGRAMRTDGSKLVTQLSNLPGALYGLVWSPTEDLLAVNYVEPSFPRFIVHVAIIDPETDSIIANTIVESAVSESYGVKVVWLEDGSGVYLTSDLSPMVITILNKSGQIKTLIYHQLTSSFPDVTDGYVTAPMWIVNNGVSGTYISLENLLTRQILPIVAQEDWHRSNFRLYWNPPGTHTLLLTWECGGDIPCYYDSRDADFSLVERATGKHTVLGSNYWISRSGTDDIRFMNRPDSNLVNPLWSPGGNRAVFFDRYRLVDNQQSGQLMLVDVQDATLTPLPHLDDIYFWQWIGNDALLVKRDANDIPYRYDLNTLEVQSMDALRSQFTWYQPSPSGRYLAGDAYDDYRIVDLRTMQSMNLIPNGNPCAYDTDYLWNDRETWLFTGHPAVCAGGQGSAHGGMSIHSMDGSIQRELTVCSALGECAGFLPERAIPHLSEGQTDSVLLQPEAILKHSGDGVAVVGWSPDGHTLVTTANSLVYFWDMMATPRLIGTQETRVDCTVCEGKWTPDGRYLSLFGLTIGEVWDSQYPRLVRRLLIAPPRPYWQDMGYGVATTQCRRLLPGQIEGSILTTQIQGQQFQVDLNYALCSRNGEWMLAESNGQLLALQPDLVNTLPVGDDRPEGQIITDYLPNSPVLIATTPRSIYGKTHMSLLDRELGQWLTVPINFFTSNAALSPDGRWIAAAGAQTVTIWDIAQIRARQVLE
ncbi:MAG TPA: hypothetical protein PLQ56_25975 [Aggregatilineales bacterium]|nr:hypothetical protein [Aggregatilineales bacterium]